ncbi:hypothetical protein XENTR_v10002091 [Xenopus tropicalis]|nr:hypothetical protein XENTR_v10002091 [Xenopus tropicalis]
MYTREQMSGDKYTCQYTAGSVTSPMSNSITLHVLDPPLAPKISLRTSLNSEPGERWYIPDEYVTVICTSPKLNMNGVRYYINGKVTHTANVNRRETAYQMLVSGRELSVRCMYWRIEHGRQIDSLMSDPVTLKIADPPPSPSISLRPSRLEYTRDESIDVICIPPQSYPVRGIRYYKETSEIYSINMPQIQTSFPVPRNAAGDYTCGYWIESGGNKILSFSSDIVTVRRTDHPPSPSISLRPLRLEYTRDESIDVICTPPQSYPVRGIRYYKDTSEIYSINLSQIQTSYPVPRNASGDYTCGYWIESGGNEILSYSSAIVTVRRTGFTTPLSSVLITRVMEAHTSKASSVSVTTAPPQSTPGIQPGASPEDPSISMTTAHPQSTPVTQSSVSPAGIYGIIGGTILLLICVAVLLRTHACHREKKHRYKPKHLWANHHSTDMENEIAGKNTALLDQDTNDKLHIYCEVEITLDPLASKKPASSPKPKPAVVPTIPPPPAMPPILLPPQSDALLKSKVAHVKTSKLQAQHSDALLDSTVMKMNPLYGDFSSK